MIDRAKWYARWHETSLSDPVSSYVCPRQINTDQQVGTRSTLWFVMLPMKYR